MHRCGCGRCRACLRAGCRRFAVFHRFPADKVFRAWCRRVIPKVLVHLGRLRALVYSSDRGARGCPKTYIHFMETHPQLACDPAGRQLYILGGRYRITERGIEG